MTLGQTVTCDFTVENTGDFPAEVTTLEEQSPFPGGTPVGVSCTAAGVVVNEGDILPNGVPCAGSFTVTIPDNPALCNTFVLDRVEIELAYTQFPVPLFAGAFATEVTLVVCAADIEITKDADDLGKVGDPVTYTFELCNEGDATVNRDSVTDTLLGDLTEFFPATLAAGECAPVERMRDVAANDPDPLPNTVTATYTSGSGVFATSDTDSASASTELFQPGVSVTKECVPDPVDIGAVVTCTIVVTNDSSDDAPDLVNGTIEDTLMGDLLDDTNTAVTSSDCTPVLASPDGTCTITTERTVLAGDPSPLCNTVTVNYNPMGFPNNITDEATDCVVVKPPEKGEGCTPGFWKQDQHFDSWVDFSPDQTLESVFDVPDALGLDDVTLAEALGTGGGQQFALLRHAVAALLNASSPDVDFDLTVAQVIAATNAALASGEYEAQKNIFEGFNEQGCPLS